MDSVCGEPGRPPLPRGLHLSLAPLLGLCSSQGWPPGPQRPGCLIFCSGLFRPTELWLLCQQPLPAALPGAMRYPRKTEDLMEAVGSPARPPALGEPLCPGWEGRQPLLPLLMLRLGCTRGTPLEPSRAPGTLSGVRHLCPAISSPHPSQGTCGCRVPVFHFSHGQPFARTLCWLPRPLACLPAGQP